MIFNRNLKLRLLVTSRPINKLRRERRNKTKTLHPSEGFIRLWRIVSDRNPGACMSITKTKPV